MPFKKKEVLEAEAKLKAEQAVGMPEVEVLSPKEYDDHMMKELQKTDPKKFIRLTIERQPKVMTMIPLEAGERPGEMQKFSISEVDFMYPKGDMVQVPQAIAEMVKARWYPYGSEDPTNLRNASQATLNALS